VLLPLATSHSLTVLPSLPEARVLPSGLNATDMTREVCSSRVAVFLPLATSHSRTISAPEDASVLLSGLNATEYPGALCHWRGPLSLGSWACRAGADQRAPRAKQARKRTTFGFCFIATPHRSESGFGRP
jgi:hypothetical protein